MSSPLCKPLIWKGQGVRSEPGFAAGIISAVNFMRVILLRSATSLPGVLIRDFRPGADRQNSAFATRRAQANTLSDALY